MNYFNVNSALIIVSALTILYFLKLIMNKQESLAKKISEIGKDKYDTSLMRTSDEPEMSSIGDVKISGDIDEEVIAVIMASVSQYSEIPLNSLKIKSIKKL